MYTLSRSSALDALWINRVIQVIVVVSGIRVARGVLVGVVRATNPTNPNAPIIPTTP